MAKSRPVYMVYCGIGKQPVAVYTELFRVVALIKVAVNTGQVSRADLFRVERISLVPGSEFRVRTIDITNSVLRYGLS